MNAPVTHLHPSGVRVGPIEEHVKMEHAVERALMGVQDEFDVVHRTEVQAQIKETTRSLGLPDPGSIEERVKFAHSVDRAAMGVEEVFDIIHPVDVPTEPLSSSQSSQNHKRVKADHDEDTIPSASAKGHRDEPHELRHKEPTRSRSRSRSTGRSGSRSRSHSRARSRSRSAGHRDEDVMHDETHRASHKGHTQRKTDEEEAKEKRAQAQRQTHRKSLMTEFRAAMREQPHEHALPVDSSVPDELVYSALLRMRERHDHLSKRVLYSLQTYVTHHCRNLGRIPTLQELLDLNLHEEANIAEVPPNYYNFNKSNAVHLQAKPNLEYGYAPHSTQRDVDKMRQFLESNLYRYKPSNVVILDELIRGFRDKEVITVEPGLVVPSVLSSILDSEFTIMTSVAMDGSRLRPSLILPVSLGSEQVSKALAQTMLGTSDTSNKAETPMQIGHLIPVHDPRVGGKPDMPTQLRVTPAETTPLGGVAPTLLLYSMNGRASEASTLAWIENILLPYRCTDPESPFLLGISKDPRHWTPAVLEILEKNNIDIMPLVTTTGRFRYNPMDYLVVDLDAEELIVNEFKRQNDLSSEKAATDAKLDVNAIASGLADRLDARWALIDKENVLSAFRAAGFLNHAQPTHASVAVQDAIASEAGTKTEPGEKQGEKLESTTTKTPTTTKSPTTSRRSRGKKADNEGEESMTDTGAQENVPPATTNRGGRKSANKKSSTKAEETETVAEEEVTTTTGRGRRRSSRVKA